MTGGQFRRPFRSRKPIDAILAAREVSRLASAVAASAAGQAFAQAAGAHPAAAPPDVRLAAAGPVAAVGPAAAAVVVAARAVAAPVVVAMVAALAAVAVPVVVAMVAALAAVAVVEPAAAALASQCSAVEAADHRRVHEPRQALQAHRAHQLRDVPRGARLERSSQAKGWSSARPAVCSVPRAAGWPPIVLARSFQAAAVR